MEHFHHCKDIASLHITGTLVPASRINDVKEAFPHSRIHWSGGTIEPRK